MANIPFATLEAADARSAEWWIAILGRDKLAEDVTTYLFGRRVRTGDEEADADLPDGVDVVIAVAGRDAHLNRLLREDRMTADEVAVLVGLYPDYAVGATYAVDDLVAYSSKLYKIVQAHTSQSDWTPNTTPALYTPVAPAGVIPAWVQPTGAQDSYALDDLVTHAGRVWKSLADSNSWEPGVVGSWRDQSNPPLWVQPSGSVGLWHNNDIAEYQGQVWRSTINNNSWAPGTDGLWILV